MNSLHYIRLRENSKNRGEEGRIVHCRGQTRENVQTIHGTVSSFYSLFLCNPMGVFVFLPKTFLYSFSREENGPTGLKKKKKRKKREKNKKKNEFQKKILSVMSATCICIPTNFFEICNRILSFFLNK